LAASNLIKGVLLEVKRMGETSGIYCQVNAVVDFRKLLLNEIIQLFGRES
jgi:hypothetical protein